MDIFSERLGFIGGLLIAAVAFLYSVSSYVPAVGYLTLLDKYVFASFLYIFFAGSLATGVAYWGDRNTLSNDSCIIVLLLAWLALHILMGVAGLFAIIRGVRIRRKFTNGIA